MKRMTTTVQGGTARRFSLSRAALLLGCLLCTSAVNAAWFKNPEQQAVQKFEQGEYSDAANEFSDDYRRGVALYRAGHYTDAAEAFARGAMKEWSIKSVKSSSWLTKNTSVESVIHSTHSFDCRPAVLAQLAGTR